MEIVKGKYDDMELMTRNDDDMARMSWQWRHGK